MTDTMKYKWVPMSPTEEMLQAVRDPWDKHQYDLKLMIEYETMVKAAPGIEYHKALDYLQSKIDALMLEYCPEEMTQEQLSNWSSHQQLSSTTLDDLLK